MARTVRVRLEMEVDRPRRDLRGLSADVDGLRAALGRSGTAAGGAADNIRRVGREASQTDRQVRDLNSRVGQLAGGGMRQLAGTVGVLGAAEGFRRVINAASDLNETISKSQQVFGAQAGAIEQWSRGSAQALGMSQRAALDGASSFQNFFAQVGLSSDASSDMSTNLVKLAADFASFHNAQPEDVMTALLAATRGEYDALQRYVPTVNAAAVETRALADTGKATAKSLTVAEKATALYAIVTEGAGAATGDFARTSEGAANQQRILMANVEDTAASIGQSLLPAYTGVLSAVNAIGPGTVAAGAAVALLSNRIAASGMSATGAFANMRAGFQLYGDQVREGVGRHVAAMTTLRVATVGMGTAVAGAGRALLGVFGGPIGFALTAATVGVGLLVRRHQEEVAVNNEVIDTGKELVGIYKDQGQAAGDAAFQRKLSQDAFAGEYLQLRKLGTSAYELQTAYAGNADVQKTIVDRLRDKQAVNRSELAAMRELVDTNEADLGAVEAKKKATDEQNAKIDEHIKKLEEQWKGTKDAASASADYAASMSGGAIVLDQWNRIAAKSTVGDRDRATSVANLADKALVLQDTMKTLSDATATAKEKADALKTAWDALYGAAAEQTDAEVTYQAAVDNVSAALEKNKYTLDTNTEAGRNNHGAIKQLLEASRAQYEADIAAGVGVEESTRRHRDRTVALERQLGPLGQNDEKTRALIQTYGRVPTTVDTDIKLHGVDALLQQLKDAKAAQLALEANISGAEAAGTLARDSYWRQVGRRAAGGPIYGPGGPTEDKVPIWASAGEYMQKAAAVDYYGGDTMDALNNMRIPRDAIRQAMAGYADGGPVATWPFPVDVTKSRIPKPKSSATGDLGGLSGPGGWQWQMAVLRAAFPGLAMFSGFRAGDMTPNGPSYHSKGRAVDLPPRMDVFNWIKANYGASTRELIHTPAGGRQVWNGREHVFTGAALQAAHYNHVHWAYKDGGLIPKLYDKGGWLEPGVTLAVNNTGHRERVLADANGRGGLAGGGPVVVDVTVTDDTGRMLKVLRKEVRTSFGGNVQLALGKG